MKEALPISICASPSWLVRPKVSFCPAPPLLTPLTGTGVEWGSITVSEIALRLTNQSLVPGSGRSAFSAFWLYGSYQG